MLSRLQRWEKCSRRMRRLNRSNLVVQTPHPHAARQTVELSGIVLANQATRIYMRFMAFRLAFPLPP
ncbi:hypothetical protein M0804_008953 [Polistes exclamans]|nr:hypothetical protein M0804_008953 [Polistes exclamans]